MVVERYTENFFAANRTISIWTGWWPPETSNKYALIFFKTYRAIVFTIILFYGGASVSYLWDMYGNLYNFLKCVSISVPNIMATCKMIFFILNKGNLQKIMETLESKEFHYEDYNGKRFFPGEISKHFKKTGNRNIFGFSYIIILSSLAYFIPLFIEWLMYLLDVENSKLPEELPFYMWLPFKYDTSSSYFFALVYVFIFANGINLGHVVVDSIFMNILHNVNLQLTLIQGAFFTIRERAAAKVDGPLLTTDLLYNSDGLRRQLNQEMRKICRHLQSVYKVCDDLENICTYVTLAELASGLFVLCSNFYLTAQNSQGFFKEITYMITVLMAIYLYCWFGNEVTLKAEQLYLSIWQCDWLSADPEFKKSMVIIMQRTQRPLCLKAGKLVPLTLETYVGIIKKSYSFCAVITSMNTDTAE